MPFLQVSVPCALKQQPALEAALEAAGALSVTLQDAHLDAADEQAIFEPGVGELPLWDQLKVIALFEADADRDAIMLHASHVPGIDATQAQFEHIDDQDWERAWLQDFQPMRFGRRTWIVPWDQPLPTEAQVEDAAIVRLDPGLAFGSGTHPTTALCLQWLDGLADAGALRGASVLDFGCGSGILGLAALKLGAKEVVFLDNDPQAIIASDDNLQRNGQYGRGFVMLPPLMPDDRFPVVVANILATALIALRDALTQALLPGGRLAMSGILVEQAEEVIAAYAEDFEQFHIERLEDWVRIDARRRP